MSYISRNFRSRVFGTAAEPLGYCDLVVGLPTEYSGVLMTEPIYRSTYVVACREDSEIHIKGLADPELRQLRVGVYETSGLRQALTENGLKNGIHVLAVSHDTGVSRTPSSGDRWQRWLRGNSMGWACGSRLPGA